MAVGQRWAVLIGVNDYANLEKLQYCGNDMAAFKDQLSRGGFADEQIVLLRSGASDSRSIPTKANIERQLEIIAGYAEKDDVLIVAFSGHGWEFEGKSYLCPMDADLRQVESLIPTSEVYAKLRRSQANLRLLIVDACRDDPRPPGSRSASSAHDLHKLGEAFEKPPEGTIVLSSCSPGESAKESDEFRQGVFMHFLLEGMAGAGDKDGDGHISVEEAAKYGSHHTKLYVHNQYNDSQRPYLTSLATIEALSYPLASVNAATPLPRPLDSVEGQMADAGSSVPAALSRPLDSFEGRPAGTERSDNGLGMKLVWCPAGSFEMGSDEGEDHEKPRHRVQLTRPFYLGKYEVTQAEWLAQMKTEPWQGKADVRDDPSCPAVYISWGEASSFCEQLTTAERQAGRLPKGWRYALPTEAQWEYACRAGSTTEYSFGDDEEQLGAHAWFDSNAREYAHPVGKKRGNAWGLHDMHGNVWEWCEDGYGEQYYTESAAADPAGPVVRMGFYPVLRGGSWDFAATLCRSAARSRETVMYRDSDLGFRLASVPSSP